MQNARNRLLDAEYKGSSLFVRLSRFYYFFVTMKIKCSSKLHTHVEIGFRGYILDHETLDKESDAQTKCIFHAFTSFSFVKHYKSDL